MARRYRLKFCKKPNAGRKAKRKGAEIVSTCDNCGSPLGRTCARTAMSACMAASDGIAARYHIADGVRVPHFFCCDDCATKFAGTYRQQLFFVVK